MQQQAERMDSAVKGLFAAGKREAAQARALAFERETPANPAVTLTAEVNLSQWFGEI